VNNLHLFGSHFANHIAKTAKIDEMYNSDLTDSERELVKHFFGKKDNRGTKPINKRRDIVNAILYVVKSGIQWRMLPKDFAP
jgi:putative transposase